MTLHQTTLYRWIADAFRAKNRQVHSSSPRGVFILGPSGNSYHDFCLTVYPVHSMNGPFLPRLNVNTTWASERLPKHKAKEWGVDPGVPGLFCKLGLEITILESQYQEIALSMPGLIEHIEAGNRNGFEKLLPFPTVSTTQTNIWSQLAHDVAEASRALRVTRGK
ncbi:MAG: hypothetical protein RLZZ398_208 [Verrucomicrobiota bacterium]|jgi:hypothetical protein